MGNSWRAQLLPYPEQYAHSEFAHDSRGLVPGRDGASVETHEDRYIVERVTKVKDDVWKFEARIRYNKKDFKASVPVPVKWAGDTPVLTLANYMIPGQGIFSARIIMFNGLYAGVWGAQDHDGKMFGKIVKNEPTP